MSSRIAFIIKLLAITLLLFGTYYLFFLRPKLELPNNLIKAEKVISKHHNNLLQNRLALLGITRLNPHSGRLYLNLERLLTTLDQTNKSGLSEIEKNESLPQNLGEVTGEFPKLLDKNKEIFVSQKPLIEKLNQYSYAVRKIYEYLPDRDLGSLSPGDKEGLAARANAAANGLEKIKTELGGLDFEKEKIAQVQAEIEITQTVLTTAEVDKMIPQFKKLKELTLKTQKEFLESREGINLITRQTNLILEYQFWLAEINNQQKGLGF